jgi:hypothetical protein
MTCDPENELKNSELCLLMFGSEEHQFLRCCSLLAVLTMQRFAVVDGVILAVLGCLAA